MRYLAAALLIVTAARGAAALPGTTAAAPGAPSDSACMTCHEDRTLVGHGGKQLYVDLEALRASRHGQAGVACVACHADLEHAAEFPHAEKLAPATCAPCHQDRSAAFAASVHAGSQPKLGGRAVTCRDCHDAHRVTEGRNPKSALSPYNVSEVCLRCHRSATPEKAGRGADFVASYELSVHAAALHRSGLGIAATCVTCHGSHDVRRVSDPGARVARRNIPSTCGGCHGGVELEYRGSIHGKSFAAGNAQSPVCTDCHGEHTVQRASVASSRVYARNIPDTCGRCHGDQGLVRRQDLATKRVSSFNSSFHGVALKFGQVTVANCASCHGYHGVLPASDPRSRIHAANLAETCGECHSNAGTNWARGRVHIAEPKRDNYGVHAARLAYGIFIAGTMGLFVLYIAADLWGARRRRGRKGES
jgi:predicted CXXCH cytochrome family protein